MAEVKKGVTVTETVTGGGRTHYPTATKIRVSPDGHLAVDRRADSTLAIYAPGKWLRAELTEE